MHRSLAIRLVLPVTLIVVVLAACGGGEGADVVEGDGAVVEDVTGASEEEARVVQSGDNVSVKYTGTLDDGEVFDSNVDRPGTLDFTVGAGQMIAGFDAAVVGMAVGDTKTVRLEPADAYGEYNDGLLVEIPRANVPEGVSVGQQLRDAVGRTVVVIEVRDDVVVIDQNHPLAGQALTFEIELVRIQ